MANCGECGNCIEEDSNPVICVGGCERVFHIDCIKDKIKTRTGHKDWKCEECVKSKKQSSLDYAEIMKQNQKLTEANLKLGETVNELKSKVRELEQYSRGTNLEISGIPVTRNEDTMKIFRDIGTAIGAS
ncbi:hypothetical protein J6590_106938 [Homalodisca vitripennis]|nr:hypothetical protein J6590_106938 [Homalodisca vitripennis]